MPMSNTAETWIHGITRDDALEFAERAEPKNIALDRIDSSFGEDSTRTLGLIEKLDGLLQLFDIDTFAWQSSILKSGNGKGYDVRMDNLADVKRWARGEKLGGYVYDRAWMAVPIEMGEEDRDVGYYTLALKLENACAVTINSSGTHSVSRVYVKPGTYERVDGDIDDLEEKARNGELDTDIAAVYTNIGFTAIFGKPENI